MTEENIDIRRLNYVRLSLIKEGESSGNVNIIKESKFLKVYQTIMKGTSIGFAESELWALIKDAV